MMAAHGTKKEREEAKGEERVEVLGGEGGEGVGGRAELDLVQL